MVLDSLAGHYFTLDETSVVLWSKQRLYIRDKFSLLWDKIYFIGLAFGIDHDRLIFVTLTWKTLPIEDREREWIIKIVELLWVGEKWALGNLLPVSLQRWKAKNNYRRISLIVDEALDEMNITLISITTVRGFRQT
jgi:hypothetical protein